MQRAFVWPRGVFFCVLPERSQRRAVERCIGNENRKKKTASRKLVPLCVCVYEWPMGVREFGIVNQIGRQLLQTKQTSEIGIGKT